MRENMIHPSTPFFTHKPVEPSLFIDREREIAEAMRCVLAERMNLNVYGEPGVGKTSFLHKLRNEIIKSFPDTLIVYRVLLSYVEGETVDLSRFFLLSIADVIWEEVFGGSYSELIQILGQPDPAIATLDKKKQAFLRIYRLLRSGIIISQLEETNEIGGNLVLSGKKGEKYSSQYKIEGLHPWEFSRLLAELISISERIKNSKIVLLTDEANYLREDQSAKILRRNFDILLNERIQYVFVTFESAKNLLYESNKVFHHEIHLGPFPGISVLNQLIDQYCASYASTGEPVLEITTKARQLIWTLSKGLPHHIQNLCRCAWLAAREGALTTIDAEHVESVMKNL